MFYEERVASFAALSRKLRALDQDAGVRLIGGTGKEEFFVFVTRFGKRYTVMTYSMGGSPRAPGRRLETAEFDSPEDLERSLKTMARGPLRAWIY